MGDFGDSFWADERFSSTFLEKADIYVLERWRLFRVVSSYFEHFYGGKGGISLLDLGCGDGVLTEELLRIDDTIEATLVDGSESMLARAARRLGGFRSVRFVKKSFQEILEGESELGQFDLCVSSMAIHHLDREGKASLFRSIYDHLRQGGRFVDIDVVRAPSGELKGWYYATWKRWMQEMFERMNVADETPDDVVGRYESPASMNRPDTLEDQLAALRSAGFLDADCYYKNGIFAVFGAAKA